jgi:nucleoside-diphosphate-sugar epimerase
MKIFVAGATGVVGKRLVPMLVANGYAVVGTTRSAEKAEELRAQGAEPRVLDILEADAVGRAVSEADPDVIVHQATALSDLGNNLRKFDELFEQTNRLRTAGADNLLAAARATGVEKFIAQSFTGWPYAKVGSMVKDEDAPLDLNPPANAARTVAAMRHLEERVLGVRGLEGIILRYGGLYGPGTSLAAGGAHVEPVRRRLFPIVGSGAGLSSFTHIDDAAGATVAAIERGHRGLYNIVDDEPAPASEWLPYLAELLGAKPPRHVPEWLGRLVAGELVVSMMTDARGASNAKAKRELGWSPIYPSWREGFIDALELRRAA